VTDFLIWTIAESYELAGTLTLTPPPPPPPPGQELHLGVDCSDANLPNRLLTYPRMRFQRVFGPTKWPTGRLFTLPAHVLPHVSCDGPWIPVEFRAYCQKLTRDVLATWKHEPHASGKNVTPQEYVRNCEEMADIASEFPHVLGTGSILTRAYIQNGGDYRQWMFRGAKFYGLDPYNNHSTLYRPPPDMFNPRGMVLGPAEDLGLQVVYPEWGIELVQDDPTGVIRAQNIRDGVYWNRLRADNAPFHPIPPCLGWWDFGGDELKDGDPGKPTLMTLVDQQR